MEQVSVREFKARISFWLKNLPVQITNNGTVVATVASAGSVTTPESIPVTTPKEQTVEGLRNPMKSTEDRMKIQSDPEPEEQRLYTEYTDEGEKQIVVTKAILLKKYGVRGWQAYWKKAAPVQP